MSLKFRNPSVALVLAVAAGAGGLSALGERYLSRPLPREDAGTSAPFRASPAPCADEPERVRADDPEFAERWAKRFKERLAHPENDPCRSSPRPADADDDRELTDEEQRRLDDMDRALAPPLPPD